MRTIILMLILLLCLTVPSFAQYTFQITTERDAQGKCINEQDISADVAYVLKTDDTKQIFTDIPDKTALDDDDLQEWYVDAVTDGFYLVAFSFSAVGLIIPNNSKHLQYWFRYSKDGVLFSDWDAVVVMKPGKPEHK